MAGIGAVARAGGAWAQSSGLGSALPASYRKVVDSLRDKDPKLARDLLAVLELLRKLDPEAADRLVQALEPLAEEGAPADPRPRESGGADGEPKAASDRSVAVYVSHAKVELDAIRVQFDAVETPEGRTLTASVERLHLSFERLEVQLGVKKKDPLVVSPDGSAPQLAADVVQFDLDGDGQTDRFQPYASGYLALDRNGNGRIDDGRELFGDQNGAEDGFAELNRFDVNHDAVIDAEDPVFDRLEVLDLVHNTAQSLGSLGINALSLDKTALEYNPTAANFLSHRSGTQRTGLFEAWHQVDTLV